MFKCEACSREFAHGGALALHSRVHGSAEPEAPEAKMTETTGAEMVRPGAFSVWRQGDLCHVRNQMGQRVSKQMEFERAEKLAAGMNKYVRSPAA
jgi:hypothetical protein